MAMQMKRAKWPTAVYILINVNFSSCHRIETSQVICPENQFTGFYIQVTLALNGWTQVKWIKLNEII